MVAEEMVEAVVEGAVVTAAFNPQKQFSQTRPIFEEF
jgi:hypothetical protein